MKTLKEQLIEKGLAKEPEGKNVGEVLVTGELQQHAQDEIGAMSRSIYRPKHKLWDHRERHGRTKTMEVKKIMEEKNIDKGTLMYKLVELMRINTTLMNVIEIHALFLAEVKATTHAAVQQMVSKLYRSGVLVSESVVGSVGMKYKVKNPALSADEMYIQYIDWVRATTKKNKPQVVKDVVHRAPTGNTMNIDFKSLRDSLKGVIPNTITVNVNHRIEVVFTTEKKGKK